MTITNPSTGKFKLSLLSPLEKTAWVSGDIPCNSSASSMRSYLYSFFAASTRSNSDISVTLVMYDSKNAETTNASLATKYVYTTKLMRRITGYSFTKATVSPLGKISSTVSIVKPSDNGSTPSSAPMSGKYTIQCTDMKGVT